VAVADVATEPGGLGAPIDVVVRFPDIRAAAAEAERLESHRFEGDVAGENHEIGPGNLAAVFLLDRPEEPASFVEADVVWPTIERGESLLPPAAAATPVARAVSAGRVPRHANEQWPVVPKIGRPPILRVGHEGREVFLQRGEIEALEFFGVVEVLAHGIGLRRMLVQQIDPELVRPPVAIRRATASGVFEGKDLFLCHVFGCHRYSLR
jgi:hypothetical protein